MKAAQIYGYGGKEVLKIVANAPKPEVTADQVIVEVHAAGVNPFDIKVREGLVQSMSKLEFPATLGGDFSGVVSELGPEVSSVKVGDAVYGQANALSGDGSYAESTPVKAESLGPKPASVDFITAAALPLVGISVYQALVEHANLQSGQKILIHGGAGGIGSTAIQLAKHLGAYVATTTTAKDADFVKELGADEAIDYENQEFSELIKDYDAVYDTVGGETFAKSYKVLKPGGVIVSMVAQEDKALSEQHKVIVISQFTRVTTERLKQLTELIDGGVIKIQIDKVFPLEDAAEALEYLKSGQHRGKVVLKIK